MAICSIVIFCFLFDACTKNQPISTALNASPSGQLARYDLVSYDVSPAPDFVFSYDGARSLSSIFEKSSNGLEGIRLSYLGQVLDSTSSSQQRSQRYYYSSLPFPDSITYRSLTYSGRIRYSYDASSRLSSKLDSVVIASGNSKRTTITRFDYTFDAAGNAVQIVQNELFRNGQPKPNTQFVYQYAYDEQVNPFTVFPLGLNAADLPCREACIFNKSNCTGERRISVRFRDNGDGTFNSVADSIELLQTRRIYAYSLQGLPLNCDEKTVSTLNGTTLNRKFTYTY